MPKSEGCALSGFVLVKKVPGTLHFLPKSSGHSFDYHSINMSHQVGYMYYGNKPSPRRRQVRLHSMLPDLFMLCRHAEQLHHCRVVAACGEGTVTGSPMSLCII